MGYFADLSLLNPEMFLAASALTLLMVGVFRKGDAYFGVCLLALAVLTLAAALVGGTAHNPPAVMFHGLFAVDAFTQTMKLLVIGGAMLTLLLIASPRKDDTFDAKFELPVVMLLCVLGMMMMVSANNLMSLYVGLELASLSQYILAAFNRDSQRSSEAGLKYFVLGSLASGMILFGASLVYGFAGSTGFSELSQLFLAHPNEVASPGVVVGMVFLIVGLCFKVSAVPFHMWTPDVYEGAPTPITAFFAIAPKVAGLALFVRLLMGPFGPLVGQWQQVVILVSVLSMAVGSIAAIRQTNIKRLLAYSSIGHVGYALIGLAAASGTGIAAVVTYLALYVIASAGAFACVLRMRRDGASVETIAELAGASKNHPWLAFALMLFMFSMAGIPPLAGFFGKMQVFLAAVQSELFGLAVIGVLTSVIAAFYYLRIVKVMYFDAPTAPFDHAAPVGVRAVLAGTAAFTLCFFLNPSPLLNWAFEASQALRL